mgnify:CR=1 FL=1
MYWLPGFMHNFPKGRVAKTIKTGQWVIPTFPQGWTQAIGNKIFKVMCDWRNNTIYKHTLQKVLDENYNLRVENYSPKKRSSNNTLCSSARKTKIQDLDSDGNISMEDATGKPWSLKDKDSKGDDGGEPKRHCISLNKSRCVITKKGSKK